MTEKIVIEILKYIEDNLYGGIKIEDIALKFHFDRAYLSRSFKKITGVSLINYINERKIIKSMNDVLYSDDKMLKIALNNGFNSLEYFSETFYRVTNFSPSSLRGNSEINKILPFTTDKDYITQLKENHEKIISIRNLDKVKVKTIGHL